MRLRNRPPTTRRALKRDSVAIGWLDRLRPGVLLKQNLSRLRNPLLRRSFNSALSSVDFPYVITILALVVVFGGGSLLEISAGGEAVNGASSLSATGRKSLAGADGSALSQHLAAAPTLQEEVIAAAPAMPLEPTQPSVPAVASVQEAPSEPAMPVAQATPAERATPQPTATPELKESPTPTAAPRVQDRQEASSRSPERTPVPTPPAASAFQAKFILAAVGPAQASQRETGVPASVTIAQAALESDWGRSRLATVGHNYFGIKASSGPGPAGVINMQTGEFINGSNVTVTAGFRAYHNMEESFADHGLFLRQNKRYAACFETKDPKEFARRLKAAGYATDPQYATKLINLMNKFNLYAYDLPE